MVRSITYAVHSLVTLKRGNRGDGYGNFERNGDIHVCLCSAGCDRYGEVTLGVGDAFCCPLPLLRGGHCREVS